MLFNCGHPFQFTKNIVKKGIRMKRSNLVLMFLPSSIMGLNLYCQQSNDSLEESVDGKPKIIGSIDILPQVLVVTTESLGKQVRFWRVISRDRKQAFCGYWQLAKREMI